MNVYMAWNMQWISVGYVVLYKTHVHRRIFKLALRERNVSSACIQAAIFLLTSSRSLWNRVKLFVTAESVLFDEFPKINYTPEGKIIISCAKDVLFQTTECFDYRSREYNVDIFRTVLCYL